jgi:hypothetical protein
MQVYLDALKVSHCMPLKLDFRACTCALLQLEYLNKIKEEIQDGAPTKGAGSKHY